jgi:hypothetical protein
MKYQTLLLRHLNTTLDLQNVIDKYQANKLNMGLEENLNLFCYHTGGVKPW